MATPIYLVKVGMNMTEGVVEEWYIPDGGSVTKGQLLYRLEALFATSWPKASP